MKFPSSRVGIGSRVGIAASVLLVAACAGVPAPVATPSVAAPGVAPAIASPSALPADGLPAPTRAPAPSPTATPGPLAASFPLIGSCAASAVPDAAPVTTPATLSAKSGTSRRLHVPILMYHRIVPAAEAGGSMPGLVVPPERFAAQMDAIAAAGWHTITMAELGADLQAGTAPPAKTVVLTFDDGYDDGYTYALPILAAHGYVATFYVIPSRFDKAAFLTSDHVRALVAAGMEIGDHTLDHVALGRRSLASVRYQVSAAASRIAQVTGVWPSSFAYPYGRMSATARKGVAACGQLRTAVIEAPPLVAAPGATGAPTTTPAPTTNPGASGAPSSGEPPSPNPTPKPARVWAFPAVYETWATRFELPRLRVSPATSPGGLAGMLAQWARG